MSCSPLYQHIDSLPELVEASTITLASACEELFVPSVCAGIGRVYLTGCGDSHHAGVAAVLAFQQMTGLPCQALTAMHFARYQVGFLESSSAGNNLVIAVSASGQASRTVEAVRLARDSGAITVALTGNAHSPLAEEAEHLLPATARSLPGDPPGIVVPGARSYITSLLALYLSAIQIGHMRRHLSHAEAARLQNALTGSAALIKQTISASGPRSAEIANSWLDATQFVYCGSGPNYATALYSAAKILEASGDFAIGQDLEEWAHLQYFGRHSATPTFIIGDGGWDEDRALEIATAAKAIGRRVAIVAPAHSQLAQTADKDVLLPVAGHLRECFSPLITSVPGLLFAADRAEAVDEPYFRAFGGGRSREGGGGISRIRTSHQISEIRRK